MKFKYYIFNIFFILSFASIQNAFCSNILRWGAEDSGPPFVYSDPENPETKLGFEREIIQAIGKFLGMQTEFVHNSWEGLIPGLDLKIYDIAINGIEYSEERKKSVLFSKPYFIGYEQLVVSKDSSIQSLEDCKEKAVGILRFTKAQEILLKRGDIEIVNYENENTIFLDLQHGRIQAALIDSIIAEYLARPLPSLKLVGEPIDRTEYVMVALPRQTELIGKINRGIDHLIRSGEMKKILGTYGLWNSLMAKEWKDHTPPKEAPVHFEKYVQYISKQNTFLEKIRLYYSFLPEILKGAWMTLEVSILSMILAVVLGFILALMRLYGPVVFQKVSLLYVEIFRGTPLLIQLYLIYYALPHVGLRLPPFLAAVIGLGLNYAACEAENYRAGLISVPKTQFEAAIALGMTRWQALSHILIPQAFRLVLPPMTNDFIALIKDSSLVSVITMVELTKVYGQLASTYYDFLGIGLLVAVVYLLLGLPFVRLARWVEVKMNPLARPGASKAQSRARGFS